MTLAAGTRLGPYEIISPLGAGGMGEVYRARDTRLGRDVAVKVLPPHLADTPEARARFEREAKTISSLNHPNICTLFDVGRDNGSDYLVMELVEGETLAQRIEKGAMGVEETLRVGIQIAEALDKAHRQGLVHRDLKPSNVMLTRTGAKLLDFGLARAAAIAKPVTDLTSTPTLTRGLTTEGVIVGTFQYMSPEQLEGAEADARSDIWALGVTLYEAMTGRRAFDGRSQASLIGAIMNTEPPSLSTAAPLAPPALERVLRGCLAKDPEERIQTAHDVRLQLQWILEGGSQAGVPAPVAARRKERDRLLLGLLGLMTLATLALGAFIATRPKSIPQRLRFEIQAPEALQFQDAPRISPNGRYIAYNGTDSLGVSRLWLRPLDSMAAQPLGGTEGAARPFWSPDSRFIGFMAGGKLKKMEVSGAPPIVVCDAPTGSDGSWGKDNVILYDGRSGDPIRRVSADGGIPVMAVEKDSLKGDSQVGWPEFLPDGKHFLFLRIGNESKLCVGTLGSQKSKVLGPCDSQMKYVQPGYLLYSRGGTLVAQRFDDGRQELVGEPIPVAERVSADAIGTSEFHASDNGILVFSTRRAQRGRLAVFDRAGRAIATLTAPPSAFHPVMSPDGKKLAVRVIDDQSRSRDIWLIEPGRDIASKFTFDSFNENYPVWAPDGQSIVYYSDEPGHPGLYRKDLTGAGHQEMVLPWTSGELTPQDWSRDGRYLLFDATRDKNGADIYYVDMTGDRTPKSFIDGPFDEWLAHFSPDSRYVAYVSNESGRQEVYVQSFPDRGGKWQISTRGGSEPTWSSDGRELYYLSADQQVMVVAIPAGPTFDPGTPTRLFGTQILQPDSGRNHYAVSPDGQTFYVCAPGGSLALPSTFVIVNWLEGLTSK